ncbi:MAG: type II secretion system F family protein [Vicinamibacterales bacterium]|nr:type II secretion system F family protein [Vicinamibacterales bacterium]
MPEFAYVAVEANGQRIQGTAVAASEDALAALLKSQDQYLVQVNPADADTIDLSEIRFFESVTRRDVIFFTSQLATIVGTGVNIVDGLTGIESQTTKAGMRKIIGDIKRGVESGQSLSQALERHPEAFDELYVNIVRSGEATGRVDRALDDLSQQLEWQDRLAARVREAATYPLLVVGLLTVLLFVLIGFTIPRFAQVYQRVNPNLEMPLPTRLVQATGLFVANNWLVVLAAMAVLFILFRLRVQTPAGSVWWSRLLLRVPVLGDVMRKVALSRFAHYFGTLHESGLEVVPSLSLMERVLGNPYLAQRFRIAVQRVLAGESLSRALASVGEFSPIVIQMVSLGETTGQMSKALQQVKQYYDREVDATVNRALTLFGPIALIGLASVFVLIAVAFYLPLFNLARAIQ